MGVDLSLHQAALRLLAKRWAKSGMAAKYGVKFAKAPIPPFKKARSRSKGRAKK